MSSEIIEKATKKSARIPKQANGQAAPAEAASASPVTSDDVRAEPTRAKGVKKARAAKDDSAPAAVVAPAKAATEKVKRAKKEKVVRDSFTMPKSDYDKLAKLKQRCLDAGVAVKKSELLRAGLIMLDAAPEKRLLQAVSAIEAVKTGRPAQS